MIYSKMLQWLVLCCFIFLVHGDSIKSSDFPDDFLFGVGTLAYQIEGAYLEDEEEKHSGYLHLGPPDDVDVSLELKDWLFALEGAEMTEKWWFYDSEDSYREERCWHTTFDSFKVKANSSRKHTVNSKKILPGALKFPVESVTLRDIEEKVTLLSKEKEQLMKQRDSSHQEALLWRYDLVKARERVVILGAVVRAEEKVRVKDKSTARKENQELLAYINILQLQLQRLTF